jgi:hypothetical protein
VYTRGEASSLGGGDTPTGELTPAQKIANKKAAANPQAIAIKAASTNYDREIGAIKELRAKVQAKGLLPTGGITNLEGVNQWVGAKVSDSDTTLLQKKVKLLAEGLQKAFGGPQGGEWAFKVAADILDPKPTSATFNRVADSHGVSLRTMASERTEPYKAKPKPAAGKLSSAQEKSLLDKIFN